MEAIGRRCTCGVSRFSPNGRQGSVNGYGEVALTSIATADVVRAMLRNPVYTGRIVWNRLDFTEAKHAGGGASRRAREEWVVAEEAHLPIVSDEV